MLYDVAFNIGVAVTWALTAERILVDEPFKRWEVLFWGRRIWSLVPFILYGVGDFFEWLDGDLL